MGIVSKAVELAKKNIGEAIKHIDETSQGNDITKASTLSVMKSKLNNNKQKEALAAHPRYREINDNARQLVLERLQNEQSITIPSMFTKPRIIKEINSIIRNIQASTQVMDFNVLLYDMINLAARPRELHHLRLDNGLISGHLKQRGKNASHRYLGFVPIDEAAILHRFVLDNEEFNISKYPGKYVRFARYLKRIDKDLTPKDLRKIAVQLLVQDISNENTKLLTMATILRHGVNQMPAMAYTGKGMPNDLLSRLQAVDGLRPTAYGRAIKDILGLDDKSVQYRQLNKTIERFNSQGMGIEICKRDGRYFTQESTK